MTNTLQDFAMLDNDTLHDIWHAKHRSICMSYCDAKQRSSVRVVVMSNSDPLQETF